jgi:hypothetical protein
VALAVSTQSGWLVTALVVPLALTVEFGCGHFMPVAEKRCLRHAAEGHFPAGNSRESG